MNIKKATKNYLAGKYSVFIEDTPLGDCYGTVRADIVGFAVNGRYYDCSHGTRLFWAIWQEAVNRGWNECHWDSPFTYGFYDNRSFDFKFNENWNDLRVKEWIH